MSLNLYPVTLSSRRFFSYRNRFIDLYRGQNDSPSLPLEITTLKKPSLSRIKKLILHYTQKTPNFEVKKYTKVKEQFSLRKKRTNYLIFQICALPHVDKEKENCENNGESW